MPSPQATAIILSDRQQTLLKQIVRRTTNPHRLVRRAQLLLAAADGTSNTQSESTAASRAGTSTQEGEHDG